MSCEELVELLEEYISQLNKWSFSEWFSLAAILISILVPFISWFIHTRRNLKVFINGINTVWSKQLPKGENYYSVIIYCIIQNQNQFPITITKATVGKYHTCKLSYDLYGDSVFAFGQEPSCITKSLKLPMSFDGFESTDITAFVFLSENPIIINENDVLIVHTTRGDVKVNISKHLNVDIEDDLINH